MYEQNWLFADFIFGVKKDTNLVERLRYQKQTVQKFPTQISYSCLCSPTSLWRNSGFKNTYTMAHWNGHSCCDYFRFLSYILLFVPTSSSPHGSYGHFLHTKGIGPSSSPFQRHVTAEKKGGKNTRGNTCLWNMRIIRYSTPFLVFCGPENARKPKLMIRFFSPTIYLQCFTAHPICFWEIARTLRLNCLA